MKPSDMFEGENSSLRQAFNGTHTDERVEKIMKAWELKFITLDRSGEKQLIQVAVQDRTEDTLIFQKEQPIVTEHKQWLRTTLTTLLADCEARVREEAMSREKQFKQVHEMELDAISCKSIEDFVLWRDYRKQRPTLTPPN